MSAVEPQTWTYPGHRSAWLPGAKPGPWDDEPDKVQWVDEATGLDCLVVRNRIGALCGYVGLPPEHPWHGMDYDAVDARIHGGLTFAAACDERPGDGPKICHVPAPERPADVWWLGFDCAHYGDFTPGLGWHGEGETYRDLGYVRAECASLAGQLLSADAGNAALSLVLPLTFAACLVALAVANGKASYLVHHLPVPTLNGPAVAAIVGLLVFAWRQLRRSHLAPATNGLPDRHDVTEWDDEDEDDAVWMATRAHKRVHRGPLSDLWVSEDRWARAAYPDDAEQL